MPERKQLVEHHDYAALLIRALGDDQSVGSVAPLFGPEKGMLDPAIRSTGRAQGARLFRRSGEETEHTTYRLELSGRVVSQHSSEWLVGGKQSAVTPEEAEPYRSIIGEGTKQIVGATHSILDPPPCGHCVLEIDHLLTQAGDLMDQLLLGAMVIAHGTM